MEKHLDIILPVTVLLLAFVLKLAIDRTVKTPNLIQALCELPVDIVFLSLSFLIAYTISIDSNVNTGLLYTLTFILLSPIIVILWRKTLTLYEMKNKFWVLLLFLNLTLSIFSLFQSMSVLLNDEDKNPIENIESNLNELINIPEND